jgi:hypothetical protein
MDSEFSNEKIGIEKRNEEVEQYRRQEDELRGKLVVRQVLITG